MADRIEDRLGSVSAASLQTRIIARVQIFEAERTATDLTTPYANQGQPERGRPHSSNSRSPTARSSVDDAVGKIHGWPNLSANATTLGGETRFRP
jgi:hypothetical protein